MFTCVMGLEQKGCVFPEPLNICDVGIFPYYRENDNDGESQVLLGHS